MKRLIRVAAVLSLPVLLGCLSDPDLPQAATPGGSDEATREGDPQAASDSSPAAADSPGGSPAGVADAPSEPPETADPPKVEPAVERVQAKVGVGEKGRSLDEYEGMIVTPAKSLFAFKERAVFDMQIPKTLQMYEATNGRKPPTHEAFMKDIIEAGMIQLPKLPPGQRYVWDPDKGELMVEKPVNR
jgi:hypothetical protein